MNDLIKKSTPNMANIDFVKTITTTSLVMNDKIADVNKSCKMIVPILIGLFRSIGRISGIPNISILSLIYHDNHLNEYITEKFTSKMDPQQQVNSNVSSKSNGSISKSSSGSFGTSSNISGLNKNCLSSNLNLADFLNPLLGYNELALISLTSNSSSGGSGGGNGGASFSFNPNLESYFMHTIGSSYYYNGSNNNYSILLTNNELKDLCQIVKKLFVRNVISSINRNLNEFLVQQQVKLLKIISILSKFILILILE